MNIGPLEYIVISINNKQLIKDLPSELKAIHKTGKIRVVDLIFVTKASDGSVKIQEVNELDASELMAYKDIAGDLMGLLTAQDIEQLTLQIPSNSSAGVILFEHTWVNGLTEIVRKGGETVFAVGMVSHETLAQINAEIAVAKED